LKQQICSKNYSIDGNGQAKDQEANANFVDKMTMLTDWVETHKAPPRSPTLTTGDKSMPLCSYPDYPKYLGGSINAAGDPNACTSP
jgi:hypothetical protein